MVMLGHRQRPSLPSAKFSEKFNFFQTGRIVRVCLIDHPHYSKPLFHFDQLWQVGIITIPLLEILPVSARFFHEQNSSHRHQ